MKQVLVASLVLSVAAAAKLVNAGEISPIYPAAFDPPRPSIVRIYPKGPVLCTIPKGSGAVHIVRYSSDNWHTTDACGKLGVIHASELFIGDSEMYPIVSGYCILNGQPVPDITCYR